ncbi:MAG TPA: HAD-IA family hydrolase [Acidimicrobiales bacterium]|nr:HAD-IA family hydrolase [Acidimicrobiales bacterium]
MTRAVVFDLDGTLLDSDRALVNAFVRCGVAAEAVTFGHVITQECARLGIAVRDYAAAYDASEVQPFEGIDDLVSGLGRWAIASHKDRTTGSAEIAALGWSPEVALFAQDFASEPGGAKSLGLVLARLGLGRNDVVFVGDTAHDRAAARVAGVRYIVAGWNWRADRLDRDLVARRPADVLGLL